jgi:hypothetical protein
VDIYITLGVLYIENLNGEQFRTPGRLSTSKLEHNKERIEEFGVLVMELP